MSLQIVIPMAGRGARFSRSGFEIPKPLIQVLPGRLMVDLVIDYLTLKEPHRFIFVCRTDQVKAFDLDEHFAKRVKDFRIVTTDRITRGPACTALLATRYIDNIDPLIIAYCDDYLDIHLSGHLKAWRAQDADGGVLTYLSESLSNSYALCAKDGRVLRTAEKELISRRATAGMYYFKQGKMFVKAARRMIRRGRTARGEFFVCPAYN